MAEEELGAGTPQETGQSESQDSVGTDNAFEQAWAEKAESLLKESEGLSQQSEGEVEEPVADEQEAEVEAEQPVISESLANVAEQFGLDPGNYKSAEDLASAALDLLGKVQPAANLGQQLAPHAEKIRAFLLEEEKAAAEKPASKESAESEEFNLQSYFEKQYGGQAWDDKYDKAIEQGMIVPDEKTRAWKVAPGYEAIVGPMLSEVNDAQKRRDDFWTTFGKKNPYEQFYGVVKEPIVREVKALVQEMLGQQQQQEQNQDALYVFEEGNKDWLYQSDPETGGFVVEKDPTTNQEFLALTDDGKRFADALSATQSRLEKRGVSRDEAIIEALEIVKTFAVPKTTGKQQAKKTEEKQAPPAKEGQDTKKSFLDRAAYSPSASSGSGTPTGTPEVMTSGDLDNLFLTAYRKSKSA